jgi:hypothetical protein
LVYSGAESATRWLSAAAAEVLLWALYGVLLGLTYPIFKPAAQREEEAAA